VGPFISDMHSKFALGPHHVCMVDIQSATAEIRRGRKEENDYRTRMCANANRDDRLPVNIGGALCSTPQSMADAHYQNAVQ